MPEGGYNAGTIFLQVVPVFRDLIEDTRKQAARTGKALGDEMEKSGRKAGERASKAMNEELGKGGSDAGKEAGDTYSGAFADSFQKGLKKLEREIKPIKINVERNELRRDFAEIKSEMKALGDAKIGVDIDAASAHARLTALLGEVEALKRAAKNISVKTNLDEAEKGLQSFITRVERAHPHVVVELDTTQAERAMGATEKKFRASAASMAKSLDKETSPAVARLKARLEEVADTDIDFDFSKARATIAEVSRELKALAQDEGADFVIRADAGEAYRAAAAVNALGNQIDGQHWDVTIDLDATRAQAEMGAFERKVRDTAKNASKELGSIGVNGGFEVNLARIKAQLDELSSQDITPDLNSEHVVAEMRGLAGELRAMATDIHADVDVRVDAAAAYAKLVPLMKTFEAIDGRKLNVSVDLDAGAAAAKAGILRSIFLPGKNGADEGANSFRSFNFVVLAAVTLLPTLVPIIAAVGGALVSLVPILGAVGVGLGVMIAGFSGIGPVIKGLSDVQKNAGQDALVMGKRIRGAARGVADAERSLARARSDAAQGAQDAARNVARAQEQSARAVQSALRSQEDAERNLAKAQRDARKAQDDLRTARKKAQDELEAAKDNRAKNALDVRQGVVDVFNSTVAYNSTMQDGAATNLDKEVASINLERARLALKEARDEQARLAEEKKTQDKQGIEGTDAVVSANERLTNALEAQKDAQRAVGDAARAVNRARIDGARSVSDALRAQDRQAASSAQAIGDARRNLAQANEDYQTAISEQSTSVRNLNDALSKVGPAGEKFARFIYGLKSQAYDLRNSIQEAMLPGVQAGLQTIIDTYGPQFQAFATRMGGVMGGLFKDAGKGLGEAPFKSFFSTYGKLAPQLTKDFGATTGNWMGVYAQFFTTIAPYVDRFSKALLRLSGRALNWAQSAKGTKQIRDFMDYAFKVGPKVWNFFVDFFDAIIKVSKALAPLGEAVLGIFDGLFKFIDGLDPKTLQAIVIGLTGLVIAFQLAVGLTALILAGAAAFATTAGIIVFVAVAIGTGLFIAYQNSKQFRDILQRLWEALKVVAGIIWTVLKPALGFLIELIKLNWKITLWGLTMVMNVVGVVFKAIGWFWTNVLAPVFSAIGTVVTWLWRNIFAPIFGFIRDVVVGTFKVIAWVWNNILWPIFDLIGHVVWQLWKMQIGPVFLLIKRVWRDVADTMSWVWKNLLKPVFDAFADHVLPHLKSAFKAAVDFIGDLWSGLVDLLGVPVRFVIDTILNHGLIDAFNWIAKRVGSKQMSYIPVPSFAQKKTAQKKTSGGQGGAGKTAYASGGVLPGYTPGRDVHEFYSPTGGRLSLSGGEAIMRPEFTAAMGNEGIDYLNRLARQQGVAGLRRALGQQAYAKGGVFWPVPGRRTGTYPGHNGVDINRGSGWEDYGDPIWAFRDGKISYVGTGRGYGQAIMERGPGYPEVVYGHTSKVYVKAGQSVQAGDLIGRVGNTGNSSAPHLHFGLVSGGTTANALALLGGANMEGGNGLSLPGWAKNILGDVKGWVENRIAAPVEKALGKFGDNALTQTLVGVGEKLVGGMAHKVGDMIDGFQSKFASAAGKFGGAIKSALSAIVGGNGVVADVKAVANAYGWGAGSEWKALDWIISHESGWNPDAANPDSSARGLFQKMTSIHGPVEKTATGQAKWGLDYIASRYGDPISAKRYWESHGSYADGGVLPSTPGAVADNGTMMYDNGGYLPPGLTTVLNLTGKPEPVFTADQFDRMGGAAGSGVHYEPHFHKTDLTAQDVAFDLDVEFRRWDRTGTRYAGRSN